MRIKIILPIVAILLMSCDKTTASKSLNSTKTAEISAVSQKQNTDSTAENDRAEIWLKNIFKCNDGGFHCFYLDKEKELCTPRFYEFLLDSNEIFGRGDHTDAELAELAKKYRQKWNGVYPLYTEEMWLFGRGNDDDRNVEIKKIEKIGNLKYLLILVFGGVVESKSEVTLVPHGNSFKIDYSKTEYTERGFSAEELQNMSHTVTANIFGKNYEDTKISEKQAKETGLKRQPDFGDLAECGWDPAFMYGNSDNVRIVFETYNGKTLGTIETLVFQNGNYMVVDGFKIDHTTTQADFAKNLGKISQYNAKNFQSEYRILVGFAGYMQFVFKNKRAVMYRMVIFC